MYHYTGCGLENVFLHNGFEEHHDPHYGKTVSVEAVRDLHTLIGLELVRYKTRLAGDEIRFLRKDLDMTQKRLAEILGTSDQTFANWEKGKSPIRKTADRLLRALYREFKSDNQTIIEAVEFLNNCDREETERQLTFEETDEGWRMVA